MNKITRLGLTTALSGVMILGTVSCSYEPALDSGSTPSSSSSLATKSSADETHPPKVLSVDMTVIAPHDMGKAEGFSEHLTTNFKAPSPWGGGAGWSDKEADKVISLPNYIAYHSRLHNEFAFYDKTGTKVASAPACGDKIETMKRDGKMYISCSATDFLTQPDGSARVKSIITTFDQNANRISVVTIDGQPPMSIYGDFAVSGDATDTQQLFDPVTGTIYRPKDRNGVKWFMTIDGVNIYAADSKSAAKATISTDKWTKDIEGNLMPIKGGYFAVSNAFGVGSSTEQSCKVYNVHTGDEVTVSKGYCPQKGDSQFTAKGTYASGEVMLSYGGKNGALVLLPNENKSVVIPDSPGTFIRGIGPDGTFYLDSIAAPTASTPNTDGTLTGNSATSTKVMAVNPKTGGAPAVIDGNRAPLAISGTGVAAFSTQYDTQGTMGAGTTFLLPTK